MRPLHGSANGKTKLSDGQVLEIRDQYRPAHGEYQRIATAYGVHKETIRRIIQQKVRPHPSDLERGRPEGAGGSSMSRHIPVVLRAAVLLRDDGKCVKCGAEEKLHIDHIVPFSKGGTTTLANLQTLCQFCNLSKGNRVPIIRLRNWAGQTFEEWQEWQKTCPPDPPEWAPPDPPEWAPGFDGGGV
jgi:hypothetical protein